MQRFYKEMKIGEEIRVRTNCPVFLCDDAGWPALVQKNSTVKIIRLTKLFYTFSFTKNNEKITVKQRARRLPSCQFFSLFRSGHPATTIFQ